MLAPNALKAFLLLADTGSFREAARRMGVSNASLSRYVSQAEETSGFTLFHRSRNNSNLTRAGQEFLPIALRLQSDLDHYRTRIEQLRRSGGGTLRIGCGPLTTRTLIQPVLLDLRRKLPDLRYQIRVSASHTPLEDLQTGKLDLFIGDLTHTPDYNGVDIMLIEKRPVIFVTHTEHPLQGKGPCRLNDILSYPLGSPHLHKYWRSSLVRALGGDALATAKVNALPDVECDDYGFLIGLLQDRRFVVGGMRETFAEALALGHAREIPTTGTLTWNICAVRKPNASSTALTLFWEALSRHNLSLSS